MRSALNTTQTFTNERDNGQRLTVGYTNWGEPYEEGARFDFQADRDGVTVDLQRYEVERLHAFLGKLLAEML